MKKWIIWVFLGIVLLLVASYFVMRQKVGIYAEDTSCSVDSDCIIKTNSINCAGAFNNVEKYSIYKERLPPSHTVCPDDRYVAPFCMSDCVINDVLTNCCAVKYDCSKCDELNANGLHTGCKNNTNPQMGWVCNMYNACNC